MIINIAGTSGSGKTFLVRRFIDWLEGWSHIEPERQAGRKAPIGYWVTSKMFRPLYIVGAYEDAVSGGCDSFKGVAPVLDLVRERHKDGYIVIYEGLFMMNHTRGPELAAEIGEKMVVLQLTTSLPECIASINRRRAARQEGKLLSKDNTVGNFVRANNYCAKMRGAGATVMKVSREAALDKLIELIIKAP